MGQRTGGVSRIEGRNEFTVRTGGPEQSDGQKGTHNEEDADAEEARVYIKPPSPSNFFYYPLQVRLNEMKPRVTHGAKPDAIRPLWRKWHRVVRPATRHS